MITEQNVTPRCIEDVGAKATTSAPSYTPTKKPPMAACRYGGTRPTSRNMYFNSLHTAQ
jgi:hypothetical protein